MGVQSIGQRLDTFIASHVEITPPETAPLGRHVAPLPRWVEDVALRLVWVVVAINLLGTVFGFLFYAQQLGATPILAWPVVPDSPLATLYIALSLSAWRLGSTGRATQLVHVLAFIGCLKYGLWAAFVQLVVEGPGYVHIAMWQFLIWSHLAMVAQAFLVQRYANFPFWAISVGGAWFLLNDLLDFFLTVLGGPHHTWVNALWDNGFDRTVPAYDHMAVAAVTATFLGILLAILTRQAIATHRQRS